MENVVINFVGKTDELKPVENALDNIVAQSGEVGQAWAKASATIANQNKSSAESTNKLAKSIEAMAVAAKSMDKVAIGGAYKDYLKQIQAQLGLTSKELIAYINNAKKAAQAAIFNASTDQEIKEITLSIEAMNDQLKELGASETDTGNKTQSLRARLREAKEELVSMAEAGLQGTPAFIELQKKAGELDDQMRDLNATVQGLGSDTKNIDGIISLASGVAGGFAIAQGAAALFGSENEEVQKALLKVNAAMSILQGLQSVQNVLQKESAASLLFNTSARTAQTTAVVAETAAEGANVVATEAATVAQTGLNTAMSLNPVGLLIVGILAAVAAFSAFSEEVESSEDRLKRLTDLANNTYDALQKLDKISQEGVDLQIDIVKNKELVNVLNAQGASVEDINDAKKKGIELSNQQLRAELVNIESAKEYAEDKNQFLEKELAIKGQLYSNSQQLLVLEIETNKVLEERARKSATGFADAEIAKNKLVVLRKQLDSLSSIKAISDAEINAIKAKQAEALKAEGLTAGEIAKINAEASLAIAENRKELSLKLLENERLGVEARVQLAVKGTQSEYDAKLALLELNRTIELKQVEVTAERRKKIEADFIEAKKQLDRQYEEQKLQTQISYLNAALDEFAISEQNKLKLTIDRLDIQRQLEIIQAEGNAAKIAEINAKYDKQTIEAKKAAIKTQLDSQLKTLDVFGQQSKAANERILADDKSTYAQKKAASDKLLQDQLFRLDLEHKALTKQVEDNLITVQEFDIAYQDIQNRRAAATIANEQNVTTLTLKEIERRTAAINAVFGVLQKGLQATLGTSGLTTALTELQNFGTLAQDIAAKVKAGTITNIEAIKQLSAAAIQATQAVINQVFADSAAARQQSLAETLSQLDEQKAKELDNKNLTEQQKADIENKYKQREKQEKIKAYEQDRRAKISQAIVNGALAITNIFATVPKFDFGASTFLLAGIAAATTLAQVAAIRNQPLPKFRRGKVDIQGPGTTTSDSIPAMISKGESVIKADSTAKWKDALTAINNDMFEPWLMNRFNNFNFPKVPDYLLAGNSNQGIDYDKLATAVANKMAGIIPAPAQIHNNFEGEEVKKFVIKANSKTEIKNKHFSMS